MESEMVPCEEQLIVLTSNSPENSSNIHQHDDGLGEPDHKRICVEVETCALDNEHSTDQSIKQILFNINKAICLRLDCIENKVEMINVRTKYLEEKVEQIHSLLKQDNNSTSPIVSTTGTSPVGRASKGTLLVGLPPKTHSDTNRGLGPNVTLITLNCEEDYPNGSWLGDDTNPEMRVRVPISHSDMLHIHSNCRTAEKMALTMLDYLFDRDTQAMSNLSGQGKHGKKQLDPLFIYGIRCHLIQRFGISENDWHRIKLNIDSKCRTAFRRKVRGQSLSVKAFRGKNPYYTHQILGTHSDAASMNSDEDSMQNDEDDLRIHQGQVHSGLEMQHQNVTCTLQNQDLSTTGEIQVLHATPEQLAQLQQTHQIQILHGDQVIQHIQDVAVSMSQTDAMHHQHSLQNQDDPGSNNRVTVSLTSNDGITESVHIKPCPDD
ncbi:protein BANP-like [Tubulanus polymorphus]|uniref:protein BANP-like n=1 Tax=Tubulanus polymorphus TaxID=672921 RepID=UPI003DA33A2A